MLIDTHAHLDFEDFDKDREEVIQRAFASGVEKIITIGCNLERSQAAVDLAEKYNKSIAQISIRWSLQLGNSVIPRSSNEERIYENSDVFDFKLSDHEMIKINGLNEDLRLEWDPTDEP